jgi:hypothetical protein
MIFAFLVTIERVYHMIVRGLGVAVFVKNKRLVSQTFIVLDPIERYPFQIMAVFRVNAK